MDAHLKKPELSGFLHALELKILSVKPWMLFNDFHRPEGIEPSTKQIKGKFKADLRKKS